MRATCSALANWSAPRGKRPDAPEEQKRLYQAYVAATSFDDGGGGRVEHGQALLERALAVDLSATEQALILARSAEISDSMRAVLGESTLAEIVKESENRSRTKNQEPPATSDKR